MKLKLIFVCLAIALAQITPSDAQSISPAGHYTNKRLAGEMRVQKTGEGWRVFVAAGLPMQFVDCMLIADGEIKGNSFEGEIKYLDPDYHFDRSGQFDNKPAPDDAVEPGHKMTITFAPKFATLTEASDVGSLCGRTVLFGRYTKRRK